MWICEYSHHYTVQAKYEVVAYEPSVLKAVYYACGSHINKAIQDAQRGHTDNRVIVRVYLGKDQ